MTAVGQRPWDVVIVGGGINGCGLARDLALRGLRVALVERRDVGSGTSGHSSGMIHGGPRYLLSERGVTRASCLDAGRIRSIAPHLCFRVPFLVPVMRGTPRVLVEALEAFFESYDAFQPLKGGRPHTRLSEAEARRIEPGLSPDVAGALTFDEWGIDGFRLCLLNALDAKRHGAEVLTYSPVVSLLREGARVSGVVAKTPDGERRLEAEVVVNVTGPWAPSVAALAGVTVRIRRGKGVHVILGRRFGDYGIMTRAVDSRWIFLEPHQNGALLGTTDDDVYALDDLRSGRDEVEYLLEGVERVFPSIRNHRCLRATVGVRPTLYEFGPSEDDLSRDHAILDHAADGAPGLVTMIGGKLAYYRAMCEELGDVVCRSVGVHAASSTHIEPLPGGDGKSDPVDLATRFGAPLPATTRLAYRHGSLAPAVLQGSADEDRAPLCHCDPVLYAEVRHAVREEGARTIDDIRRRTRMGEGPCQGTLCNARAAAVLHEEGVVTAGEAHRQIVDALQVRWRSKLTVLEQPGSVPLAAEELMQSRHFLVGDLGRLPWA